MRRLYLSPALRYFEPLLAPPNDRAAAHMCFEYDLVEALRPSMVVDVGTGDAASFFVLCQSMREHDVDGILYGIDAWADDDAKSIEDPTHSSSINHRARTYYRGMTYLLRTDVMDALKHFEPDTVDLVRIDSGRCGKALDTVLDAWLSRVSPGGALLCTRVSEPGFRAAWDAASKAHTALTMKTCGGLGVLIKRGQRVRDAALIQLIVSPDPTDQSTLEQYYEHAALHHSLRRTTRPHRSKLSRRAFGAAKG